jgi:hypothetical protein
LTALEDRQISTDEKMARIEYLMAGMVATA